MKDKKSFVLYADLMHTLDKIPNEDAGRLFKIILNHVNGKEQEIEDVLMQVLFEPIKQQLLRDATKWEEIKVKRSQSGKKGGVAKASKTKQMLANASKSKQNVANVAVNVNDSVSVSVNDSVINKGHTPLSEQFKDYHFNGYEDVKESSLKLASILDTRFKKVMSMKSPFTPDEICRLVTDYDAGDIMPIISDMENKPDLLKKYDSANLTCRGWIRLRKQRES